VKPSFSGRSLRREDGAVDANIAVIGLAFADKDRSLLAEVCSRKQWNVLFADTFDQARVALDQVTAAVILCDRDLPGGEWRDVVQVLASSPQRTCVILISRVVDDYLWNEVAQRGGYDVLLKPLREEDVVRANQAGMVLLEHHQESLGAPGKQSSRWQNQEMMPFRTAYKISSAKLCRFSLS
jgi:DNA-binding NtrC family response regulator